MKIYVIGIVGSGKSTYAKKISSEYHIPYFELDNITWKYNPNEDVRRDPLEVEDFFNRIIAKDNWVIEDVGRKEFSKGLEAADKIIYLNLSRAVLYYRIIRRWISQRNGKEKARYKPTIKMLRKMIKWCNKDLRKRDSLIKELNEYSDKLILLRDTNDLGVLNEGIKY